MAALFKTAFTLGYGAFGLAAGCQNFADNTIAMTIDD